MEIGLALSCSACYASRPSKQGSPAMLRSAAMKPLPFLRWHKDSTAIVRP